jgi:hypothetical protein
MSKDGLVANDIIIEKGDSFFLRIKKHFISIRSNFLSHRLVFGGEL